MTGLVMILIALAIVCIRLFMACVRVLVWLLVWLVRVGPGVWRTLRWRMTLYGLRTRGSAPGR